MPLRPHEAVAVDLRALTALAHQRPDLLRAGVQVMSDGRPGDLIGALSVLDRQTGLTQEIPLRDTGAVGGSTGSYPWRLDADYAPTVSITM